MSAKVYVLILFLTSYYFFGIFKLFYFHDENNCILIIINKSFRLIYHTGWP